MSANEHLPLADTGLLRFTTCGSVDDGKSTLIGRLLYDSKAILADTLNAIEKTSQRRGMEAVDLSLLTDGLQAEREQGITIDVAYRYFSTGRRKYIIADAPGHEQYTRNMVTAASTADLAIILIDARKGILTQTRRHSAITKLMNVPHAVLAINKMDLVDYDQAVFDRISAEYREFAKQIGLEDVQIIPMSALNGDMIVDRGDRLDWYTGPTLMEFLEAAPLAHSEVPEAFRFPVQFVCTADGNDYRGFMGRVESGAISIGDAVKILPNGLSSTVKSIDLGGRELQRAVAGQSVSIQLADQIDISRGDMLTSADEQPRIEKQIEADVCWLSETPLDTSRKYIVRHTARETRAMVAGIAYRLDINTLEKHEGAKLSMNDIGRVSFKLQLPLAIDSYAINRATGAFVVIDETTNNTVGAGMVL